jgi:ABC-2 type transport system ATP-binding protein
VNTEASALSIEHLDAGYEKLAHGSAGHRVLIDVNLAVAAGEWVALLGPNASGKTTLLHCVVGMMAPTSGAITVCGQSLRSNPAGAKGKLGFACAPERLPGLLTGRQCLEIYAAAKGLTSISADVLQLAERFQYMPMLDRFVDACSLGTRQKLAVLLALLGDPQLVVLDEAFNGLDPASALAPQHFLRDRVSRGKCSVLLATHALDIVERYADRAALLLNGRIAHEWRKDELAAMRANSEEGFEAALAAVAVEVEGK